ncbi:MAG: hypothetical protein V4772_18345, partial [Pseudomonadota bacterium]
GKEMLDKALSLAVAGSLRPEPPSRTHAHLIEKMCHLCEQQRDASHLALRSVVHEFLYDWHAIMRVLAQAIHAARQGWPAPALPPVPLALRTHQIATLCD